MFVFADGFLNSPRKVFRMHDNDDHQSRRFFGRRKGHQLKPRQAELMDTLLPQLAVDLETPMPENPAALFKSAARIENLWLEIGFGGGEHLAAHAAARTDTGFIGCEPFINGMAKALALVEVNELKNVRLHFGDATQILDWLPDASLAGVDLLYPDPWPKARHWKRRFAQDESIAAIARVLKPGAMFRVATDIPHYAAWTLERVLRNPDFIWTAERADDWRKPWGGWTQTRYEAKAIREGRTPAYFIFLRR
jgi:tRNA (guanine-N7-)-methyltransferase